MSWIDDLLNNSSKAVDVYSKVRKVRRPPVRRSPVRRAPVRRVAPVAVQKSFIQQNQTQLLAVAGLLALLLVVRKK